jgi:two-component system chemotaxis response regulator CheB
MPDPLERMPEIVAANMNEQENGERRGQLAVYTCPECGGALWQVDEDRLVRFRCHVGHAYYAETLLSEQSDGLEAALWTAVRIFKERTVLAQQLAERARAQKNGLAAERFDTQARTSGRNANLIQQLIVSGDMEAKNADAAPKQKS